jgi:hypothetical protein
VKALGRNHGGYHGETIDLPAVLNRVQAAARQQGWTQDRLSYRDAELLALRRMPPTPRRRVYLSTGIHGDEPAGPLALARLLELNQWPADLALWVCPCLNPAGLTLNRRENAHGLDLNRQYRNPQAAETVAHLAWLSAQPDFNLALCLHEDWEAAGFYLYELNPGGAPSAAEEVIRSVAEVCPIDRSETIEGRPAAGGIIRPPFLPDARPDWPEAFYLVTHKTRHSYTLEAPSDFPLPLRVDALCRAVAVLLNRL